MSEQMGDFGLCAMRGEVDPAAPVRARGSIVINRAPDLTWAVLADVSNWPEFRSDIHSVVSTGAASPGGSFSWSTGDIAVQSRFAIVEPGRRLTWTTAVPGLLEAVHVYRFEATVQGATLVSAEESINAPIAAPQLDDAQLGRQIASWLAGIKAFAERQ